MNYFELLGLPATFAVDVAALAANYRRLQTESHPDRFVTGSDAEQRFAIERATEINEAYQTLVDPVRRAMYLLWLKDINGMDEKNTSMPHDFLMEQIEWREAIADAKLKEDPERLEEMGIELASVLQSLGDTFSATYNGEHWAIATTLARKMRFTQKLIDEVDLTLGELES